MTCAKIRFLIFLLGFFLIFVGGCSDDGSSPTSSMTIHRVSGTHISAPGEELTLYGDGLGTIPGKVALKQDDRLVDCLTVYWGNRAIAFEIPEGIEGLCDLFITCPAGEETIPKYVNVKADVEPGTTAGNQCEPMGPLTPVGAAYYAGKIWLFQPVQDQMTFKDYYITYQTYDMAADKWSKGCFTLKIGGSECYVPGPNTKVAPIIVNNWLLIFWFNPDGSVDYAMYAGQDENGLDIWQQVPGTKPDINGEYFLAPGYNPTTNRLELYYTSDGNIVCFYADVPDPEKALKLTFQQAQPTTPLPASKYGPGAAMVQTGANPSTYQTMLAYADDEKSIHICYLDDSWNKTRSDTLDEKTNDTPYLVNLENGLVALLWEGTSHYGDVKYYDWQNPNQGDHGWTDKEAWKTELYWLSAVAAYDPVTPSDPNADPDYPDMEGEMYCFYVCVDGDVHWRIDRDLGTWRHQTTTTADFSKGVMNPDNTPGPTFTVCPLLGVIDAPPYVINGGDVTENKTHISLVDENGIGSSCDVDLKGGPFLESGGEKKPFTLQVSVGATYANKAEFHQSLSIANSLPAADPPQIMLVMVAPVLDFAEYVRYDTDNNEVPGDTFTMVTVKEANLFCQRLSMEWADFDENFPNLHKHKAGCVNTYDQAITDGYFLHASNTWQYNPEEDTVTITFTKENTNATTVGGYAKMKIGGNIKEMFGLGVEGEFDMNMTSTTTVSTKSELSLWNPSPEKDGDVTEFYVTAYWMNPMENADWVPTYRQGQGDAPWFITYYVDNIVYQGGVVTPGCQ